MRTALTAAAVMVVLVLSFVVKRIFVATPVAKVTASDGISVYDLHVHHPGMTSLRVEQAPLP